MSDEKGNFIAVAYPNELQIVTSDPQTHMQYFTICNPYYFAIRFKVKCTNRENYSVTEPQGILKPKCSIKIIIRHDSAHLRTSLGTDIFRVEISAVHDKAFSGSKDIFVRVVEAARSEFVRADDHVLHHQSFLGKSGAAIDRASLLSRRSSTAPLLPSIQTHSTTLWIFMSAAVICAAALMLPTQGLDVSSVVPEWLYLSVPQKLVFAYILGVVTLLVLKPG